MVSNNWELAKRHGALDTENARIARTMLGFEDHGIFTFSLTLEGSGWGQGYGAYVLGGEFGTRAIQLVLKTVGVERWEDLKGSLVRVRRDKPDIGSIVAIGHIIKDQWCDLEVLLKEVKAHA